MKFDMTKGTTFLKKHKKLIIAVVVVLAVGLFFFLRPSSQRADITVNTTTLNKMTLSNTVSLTGTVESTDSYNVYSTLSYKVEDVLVEVGDQVEAGDLLCKLDTDSLELDIAQQQASINAASQSSQHQVAVSEKNYQNAKDNLENDLNSQVLSAESNLEAAKQALQKAEDAYDDADSNYNDEYDEARKARNQARQQRDACNEAVNQRTAEQTAAQQDVEAKQAVVNNLVASGDTSSEVYLQAEAELTAAKQALETADQALSTAQQAAADAQAAYQQAESAFDVIRDTYDQSLDELQDAVDNAQIAYDNAVAQRDAAVNSAEQNVESLKDSVTTSELAGNNQAQQIALQKLQDQLEQASITAPISGTVTAVYAVEGNPGSGLLFVIEDTDALKIVTSIKEYDVDNVELNMPVEITTDGTGDEVFEGTVSKIAPAANKAEDGSVVTGTNAEFETEVAVTSPETALRIGMSAKLNVLIDQVENAYGVPYDAILTDENGNEVIYLAVPNDKGEYIVESLPVTTGLETDIYVEITGDIPDGGLVIMSPSTVQIGQKVQIGSSL